MKHLQAMAKAAVIDGRIDLFDIQHLVDDALQSGFHFTEAQELEKILATYSGASLKLTHSFCHWEGAPAPKQSHALR